MFGTMMTNPLSISMIIEHANSIHGNKSVYSHSPNGEIHNYSYKSLYKRIMKLANAITELGIQKGDIVGTYATNTSQHLELCLAIPITGLIVHPLNIRLSSVQLAKIIRETKNKIIFVDSMIYDKCAYLLNKIDVLHTIEFNSQNSKDKSSCEYEMLLSNSSEQYKSDIQDENLAMALCYTSGTNGEPKGVLYTHRSMLLHTFAVNQADVFGLTEADVVMPLVPMYHALGWGLNYAAMFIGSDLVLSNPSNDHIIDLIAETKVTVAAGVPTIWRRLLPELEKRKNDVSSLTRVIVGGEPMPVKLIEIYEKELNIEIRHAWGMTEMSPTGTFSMLKKRHHKLSDKEKYEIKALQGQPIPGVKLRVVDEKHSILPNDGTSVGEVQTNSPWTARSYINNGLESENFTADGWLRTGDLATINPEGYMKIVDRTKALIISGGESISPMELETALLKHPLVIDSAVIGITDDQWGERPLAVVVLSEQIDEDISEILKQHLSIDFPKFWIPDKFIFVDKIPRTGTGKTDKNIIIQEFGAK